jgi:predicted kinase
LPSTRLSDWESLQSDLTTHHASWEAVVDSLASSDVQHEILLIVAPPASGKSTLARAFAQKYGYTRINQDELGNFKKCLAAGKDAITQKKSLVVDNTNLNKETRFAWIELAKDSNYKVTNGWLTYLICI